MTTSTTPDATDAAIDKAAEHDLDLAEVAGSGAGGKITAKDVEQALADARGASDEPGDEGPRMVDRDHRRDCPANPDRIETYQARQPVRDEAGNLIRYRNVPVVHCLDCGETVVAAAKATE